MVGAPPRLLVTLSARPETARSIASKLPDLPWTFATGRPPAPWTDVRAMLVGTIERELEDFDARRVPRLEFVQRIYTGLDGFPFDRFPSSVRIAGNVGAYAPFVAEHAVTLALSAARSIPAAYEQVRRGVLRPAPPQRLLFGRTAVLLGYGEIGRAVAERLRGFGMRIVGVNRSGRAGPGDPTIYASDRIGDAVAEGDLVIDARPLTTSTSGSVDSGLLARCKPDAIYVNVGRAATIDPDALYHHLQRHPEFRAALDVWWEEDFGRGTISNRHPFTDLPNFLGTPHSAGVGPGVEGYVLDRALDNLARFFGGETPRYLARRDEYDL